MKLEVGMYVRTKHNGICKLYREFYEDSVDVGIGVFPEIDGFFIDEEEINYIEKIDITKASHNIIDLIEVGDYVNGHQVYEVDRECCRITLNGGSYGDEFRLTYLRPALGENMGIKSIVTKEQFSQMEYKVGG